MFQESVGESPDYSVRSWHGPLPFPKRSGLRFLAGLVSGEKNQRRESTVHARARVRNCVSMLFDSALTLCIHADNYLDEFFRPNETNSASLKRSQLSLTNSLVSFFTY